MNSDVALLTERRYLAAEAPPGDWYLANILAEDRLLQAALAERHVSSVRVDWNDPHIDWSQFRCVVVRTTWDYFHRFEEFSAWLRRVERQTLLCNPAAILWWNMDKHYLADLEARGIRTVASRFVERGTSTPLGELLEETRWDEAVIKPCVSGGARYTYRVNRENVDQVDTIVRPLLEIESLMLQPFEQAIVDQGEDSLMVFAGKYSHAVRKVAKAGDFRVQDDHGGTVHDYQATVEQIDLAERAIAACDPLPSYGRVDVVRNNQGELAVMELELVEPELWLRHHPPAAVAFADAITRCL